jgi:hypothetical protein
VQVILDGARADEQQSGYLRVRAPLGREPGDLRLLRGELVDRLDGTFAHRLAGGRKLALSALGERFRAHAAEHLVDRAQVLARVDAAVLTTQPLAVQKAAAAEFERRAAVSASAYWPWPLRSNAVSQKPPPTAEPSPRSVALLIPHSSSASG